MIRLNTERLKTEMFRCNMKQRDLAERIDVTEVSVSRYVNGSRMPRGNILVEIAKALNVTPAYLTGTEEYERPDDAFAFAKTAVRTHGKQWTYEQKKALVEEVLAVMY